MHKLTSGLLFGISPVDPATFAGATVFLLTVAAIATAIPGARALSIAPARTLRPGLSPRQGLGARTTKFAPPG